MLIGGISGLISVLVAIVFRDIFKLIFKEKTTLIFMLTIFTGITTFTLLRPFVSQRYEMYTFEENIKAEYPLFKTISLTDPKEFKEFIDKSKNSIYLNEPPEKIAIYSAELINNIFPKYLLKASNETIFDYLNAQVHLYRELYKDDPDLVVKIETGQLNSKLSDLLDSEKYKLLFLQISKAKENVVLSGENAKNTDINKGEVEQKLKEIIFKLEKDFGQKNVYLTFTTPNDPSLIRSTEAQIFISLYEALITSGKENAAPILKYLLLQK